MRPFTELTELCILAASTVSALVGSFAAVDVMDKNLRVARHNEIIAVRMGPTSYAARTWAVSRPSRPAHAVSVAPFLVEFRDPQRRKVCIIVVPSAVHLDVYCRQGSQETLCKQVEGLYSTYQARSGFQDCRNKLFIEAVLKNFGLHVRGVAVYEPEDG